MVCLIALMCSGMAQASTILGGLWHVDESYAEFADPSSLPASGPDVTFKVGSSLNFDAGWATVGEWLASGSAAITAVNTAGVLDTYMDDESIGSLVKFTGLMTVSTGQVISITHDDGIYLSIGEFVFSSPNPTNPFTDAITYTGPGGTLPFELIYAECCSGAAVLKADLPSGPVPEPATMTLIGSGLLGLAAFRRKKG